MKVSILRALEFEEALLRLKVMGTVSDKKLKDIKEFAIKMSKYTPESPIDICNNLYNFIAYPNLLDEEIKKLEERLKNYE